MPFLVRTPATSFQFHAYQVLAHRKAWESANILHRDVSVGNIMIDVESDEEQPIGFLNDWDLCKYVEDFSKPAAQPGGRSVSARNLASCTL